jgi:hypothetical protein
MTSSSESTVSIAKRPCMKLHSGSCTIQTKYNAHLIHGCGWPFHELPSITFTFSLTVISFLTSRTSSLAPCLDFSFQVLCWALNGRITNHSRKDTVVATSPLKGIGTIAFEPAIVHPLHIQGLRNVNQAIQIQCFSKRKVIRVTLYVMIFVL